MIGAKLRQFRIAKGMTLDQLAEASKVSRGTIHRIELQRVSPRMETLVDLCAALGSSLSAFFSSLDGPGALDTGGSGLRQGALAWLEHAEALIRNSADSLSILDPDGFIVFESESGVLFHAGDPELRRALPWWTSAHPEDQAELRQGFEAFVLSEQTTSAHLYRAAHRDGSWHWLRTVLSRKLEHPLIQGIIASAQDVTQLKQAEEAAQRSRRYESLAVALGGVTHVFSNVLMGVQSHLAFAEQKAAGDDRVGSHLASMKQALTGADRLLGQMRDFAGTPLVSLAALDLNELVRGLEPVLADASLGRRRFQQDLDPALPLLHGDRRLIQRILLELLVNAFDAVAGGDAEVTIRTARAAFPEPELGSAEWLERSRNRRGECVLVEVRDGGCGIRPEDLPRVCEPFFSSKFAGRGIGLAAVLGSVRAHQGALRLTSRPGQGTCVQVFLPAATPAEARSQVRVPGWRPEGILLVDDDPFLRDCIRQMLIGLGHQALFEAGNGEEAIAAFRAHPGEIGLVLLDLDMPVMGGLEAFTRLRALDPALGVVFSTGAWEGNPDLVNRCSDGITGILCKPFNLEELSTCLGAYL
jgi:PAS domain S-box-containing protein